MNTQAPSIEIIILNWNGKADTLACLDSVRQIDYPNYKVMVVDNGSTDDSVIAIRDTFPDIELVETGANLGYAGGNNFGIRIAMEREVDYVLLLNNDTVVDPQMLHGFVEAALAKPEAGAFAAKIFYFSEPTKLWYAGGSWRHDGLYFVHDGMGEVDDSNRYGALREIDYACGCALFMRHKALDEVGLLDETFFLTYEETDWCYRAREKGFASVFVPEAKVWHKVSASFGGQESPLVAYFMARNKLLWAERHLPRRDHWRLVLQTFGDIRSGLLPPFSYIRAESGVSPRHLYWGVRAYIRNMTERYREPTRQASLAALRDFLLRRFGDCPDAVRKLARKPAKKTKSSST